MNIMLSIFLYLLIGLTVWVYRNKDIHAPLPAAGLVISLALWPVLVVDWMIKSAKDFAQRVCGF